MGTSSKGKAWHRVSLRLMGDELSVGELEDRLQLVPTHVGKKGEHYKNDRSQCKYETNIWVWRYPSDSNVELEKQIISLLEVIEPKESVLQDIISKSGAKAELFLGTNLTRNEVSLSDSVLRRIHGLGLSVDVDFY